MVSERTIRPVPSYTRPTSNHLIAMTDKTQNTLSLPCPICKKTVLWNDQFPARPFCSERCRLIDLGEWASESHRIAGDPAIDDLMSDDLSGELDSFNKPH